MVEARSSPTSSIMLQQPAICSHKEKWRDPACTRFPSFEHSLTHRKVLDEGCEQVHRQNRPIREHAIQHHQSHVKNFAQISAPLTTLKRKQCDHSSNLLNAFEQSASSNVPSAQNAFEDYPLNGHSMNRIFERYICYPLK